MLNKWNVTSDKMMPFLLAGSFSARRVALMAMPVILMSSIDDDGDSTEDEDVDE